MKPINERLERETGAASAAGAPAINLQKGGNVNLTKNTPGLTVVKCGAGWDIKNGKEIDIDLFAFCLDTNGKYVNDKLCFFNSLSILDGAITHSGDNRTGAGDGDDETITVDLSKIPSGTDRILFGLNIYNQPGMHFGEVANCSMHVYAENDPGKDLAKFDLQEDFGTANGIIMAELYHKDSEWKFRALGETKNGSITEILGNYK